MAFVDVHDVGDTDVWNRGEVFVVILAATARGPCRMAFVVATKTNDRNVDGFVRAGLCTSPCRPRKGESRCGSRSLGKEAATIHEQSSFGRRVS
jgi:hypothetical protein